MQIAIELMERGLVPEWLVRAGIRAVCRERLGEEKVRHERSATAEQELVEELSKNPIAVETAAANEQHYELPPSFFAHVLGRHRKYSSGFFPVGTETLSEGEERMLELYDTRAHLVDGQDVLELGCGWGSLTLWMAARYPNSRITAVSNSKQQRETIEALAKERGIDRNLRVITADINTFSAEQSYDRVVSVEMFEHLRNYRMLFERINSWLRPNGHLFVHIFCHRHYAYLYETAGATNWMGRYFFTGGTMPSENLFRRFNEHLEVQAQWWVPGRHYGRTADLWAAELWRNEGDIMPILEAAYGSEARRWFYRWWMFFLACAELFHYREGTEWGVAHYRFAKRSA